jgi:4-carboxymuconolactone decarboxylase
MARVRYLTREDLPESHRHIYDEIASSRGTKMVAKAFRALLHSPEGAARVSALGAYLRFESDLQAKTRELVILTVAREMDCEYEWTHHEPLARAAGLSDTSIAAVREAKAADGLPQDEVVFVRYVQELLRDRHISEVTFKAALEQLGTGRLVDLTLTVGYYTMLALAFSALHVEADES